MKKLVSILLLTLALGAFAFSQAGAGGGGGRGQGRGQRGGNQYGTAGAQYSQLRYTDTQADLKLTDDQKTKLTAAQADMRTAMTAARTDNQGDQAAIAAASQKATAAYNTAVAGILTDDQKKRLMGIFLQVAKGMAVTNPDVQSALGMTSDQVAKAKDLVTKEAAANRSIPNDDPAAAREARAKNAATLDTDLMGVLTDDQKSKFTAMSGDKFTPDPAARRGGGFGGGGGRRGGGGGAGGGGAAGGGGN